MRALEKKDPQQKLEQRKKREAARSKTRPDEANGANKREARVGSALGAQASRPHPSRYVSSSVRECHLDRAGYRCEFRGPEGVRCTARVGLEIDR